MHFECQTTRLLLVFAVLLVCVSAVHKVSDSLCV